jgi:hypothetical protein
LYREKQDKEQEGKQRQAVSSQCPHSYNHGDETKKNIAEMPNECTNHLDNIKEQLILLPS